MKRIPRLSIVLLLILSIILLFVASVYYFTEEPKAKTVSTEEPAKHVSHSQNAVVKKVSETVTVDMFSKNSAPAAVAKESKTYLLAGGRDYSSKPGQKSVLPLIYTVQAGSFEDMESALEQYDAILSSLGEEDLDYLRIEKIGPYYTVRIGKIEDQDEAENFHDKLISDLPDSILMKAYIKDERIKHLYSHTPRSKEEPEVQKTEAPSPPPVEKEAEEQPEQLVSDIPEKVVPDVELAATDDIEEPPVPPVIDIPEKVVPAAELAAADDKEEQPKQPVSDIPKKITPETKVAVDGEKPVDSIIEEQPAEEVIVSLPPEPETEKIPGTGSHCGSKDMMFFNDTAENILAETVPGPGYDVAMLPLENLTDSNNVMQHIIPLMIDQLEKKGLTVLHGVRLENFICRERVRTTGYVTMDLARKIKNKFKARTILVGSLVSYSTDKNPSFGILSRLIDSSNGTILWADFAAATGEDFVTILGLGMISEIRNLVPRVVQRLLTSFHTGKSRAGSPVARKVIVMPFRNISTFKNAGIITMYMFLNALVNNENYEPIEYGNVRNQIVNYKIMKKGELDHSNINALSRELDAWGILVGVVDRYSEGTGITVPPEVTVSARLLDGSESKILWYNSLESSGEEDIIALDWGRQRTVHQVAYKVVFKLAEELGHVTPQ
jgi:TolB-like protein